MNPIIYMTLGSALLCFGSAYYLKSIDYLCTTSVVAAIVFLGVGCAIGLGFAIWDRDRLHSERDLASLEQLDIIRTKGGPLPLNPADLMGIGDPYPTPKMLGESPKLADSSNSDKEEHEPN